MKIKNHVSFLAIGMSIVCATAQAGTWSTVSAPLIYPMLEFPATNLAFLGASDADNVYDNLGDQKSGDWDFSWAPTLTGEFDPQAKATHHFTYTGSTWEAEVSNAAIAGASCTLYYSGSVEVGSLDTGMSYDTDGTPVKSMAAGTESILTPKPLTDNMAFTGDTKSPFAIAPHPSRTAHVTTYNDVNGSYAATFAGGLAAASIQGSAITVETTGLTVVTN